MSQTRRGANRRSPWLCPRCGQGGDPSGDQAPRSLADRLSPRSSSLCSRVVGLAARTGREEPGPRGRSRNSELTARAQSGPVLPRRKRGPRMYSVGPQCGEEQSRTPHAQLTAHGRCDLRLDGPASRRHWHERQRPSIRAPGSGDRRGPHPGSGGVAPEAGHRQAG